MKHLLLAFTLGLCTLAGCNNIPEEPATSQVLQVYPNPATSMAHVSFQNVSGQAFTLQIYDTKGAILLEEKGNQAGDKIFPVDLYEKPEGRYQVVLQLGEQVSTSVILKK